MTKILSNTLTVSLTMCSKVTFMCLLSIKKNPHFESFYGNVRRERLIIIRFDSSAAMWCCRLRVTLLIGDGCA
jgi:hypothetical protein